MTRRWRSRCNWPGARMWPFEHENTRKSTTGRSPNGHQASRRLWLNRFSECLGWLRLDGEHVWSQVRRFRLDPYRGLETRLPWYHAMVYRYVPQGTALNDEVVQAQYDFYYLADFCVANFKEDNWRGSGVLVTLLILCCRICRSAEGELRTESENRRKGCMIWSTQQVTEEAETLQRGMGRY
ncbi:hypothetical protein MAPG_10934 [Magnaporthiopsis poae ATCC 64411]|uniref:Uncharacterized protein n=1 Tax=Magnaporthiopsis poae (strain ATCC 64411 / 73-15) TaxID=644358 RepID=A0A0C4EDX4_MAGP6|nr:hypothetical protein MAPG_10934 [Magnaporthiopsis poae ATCC 64411]